jgi:SnoaL-like domain
MRSLFAGVYSAALVGRSPGPFPIRAIVLVVQPLDVVRAWFDAHSRGDLAAARTLLAPEAPIHGEEVNLRGFDAFMSWYDDRRSSRQGFGYEVVDLLGGEHHAAAIIRLSDAAESWRQVAVYEVEEDRITSIMMLEDHSTE